MRNCASLLLLPLEQLSERQAELIQHGGKEAFLSSLFKFWTIVNRAP